MFTWIDKIILSEKIELVKRVLGIGLVKRFIAYNMYAQCNNKNFSEKFLELISLSVTIHQSRHYCGRYIAHFSKL
jgi:hypothetical protein